MAKLKKTNKQNESSNALIWEHAPKGVYLSLPKLNFAVYDAVSVFNDGRRGSLKVLEGVGIEPGYYTTELCFILNLRRKRKSLQRCNPATKKRRKIIRAQKKKAVEKTRIEGRTYKAGEF